MLDSHAPLKMLLIVPHPDDEVYGAAGTLMSYLARNERVGLVTLTRGEAGRTLGLCDGPEELARMRDAELRACVEVIGLSVFEQHQFPDKALAECDFEALVAVALDALERFQPEIVLTFPPNGSNGHPDHVTTHRAVKAAWERLDHAARPRLWYYAMSVPPEKPELQATWLAPNITHDVTQFVTRKLVAISCHRTQALSTVDFLRKHPERITQETFHEVWPLLDL